MGVWGIPWQSSGWDLVLSLPGSRFSSLVGELRSHKLLSCQKKKKKRETEREKIIGILAFLNEIAYFQ